MSDRELLELAAKAAGIRLEWDGPPDSWQPMYYEGKTYHGWNPLENDGDALRLAVKLRMLVDVQAKSSSAIAEDQDRSSRVAHDDDPYAATRRAIVRAAAEIGNSIS